MLHISKTKTVDAGMASAKLKMYSKKNISKIKIIIEQKQLNIIQKYIHNELCKNYCIIYSY